LNAAQARATILSKLEVVIKHKAGDEGKLFGSVGTHNIAEAITAAGAAVEKNEIRMPQGVIRHIGEYPIDIYLHADVIATLSIKIAAE
jgi:large subunit ribosomal protein L9